MDRRSLLKYSAAVGATYALPGFLKPTVAKTISGSNGTKIMTVSDGTLQLPPSFALPNVPKEELEALIGKLPKQDEIVERPLNLTVLRDGDRVVLFDIGSGSNFMPSAGKLVDSLDAAGVSLDEITDVVFTHAHPDHLWGILDDFDEVLAPEANLHMPRKEFEFWMDDGTIDKMSEERKVFAVGAKNRLEVIEDQVNLFEDGAEVVSKIEAMATNGHTPGHTSFVIHASDEPTMVIGDALTHEVLSFQRPEWPTGGDQDKDMAVETRKTLLDRLAADKIQIVGYHLPNEGIGRVEKVGTTYRFIPT